jgi:hypothetical protein
MEKHCLKVNGENINVVVPKRKSTYKSKNFGYGAPCVADVEAQPASCTMSTGSLSWG